MAYDPYAAGEETISAGSVIKDVVTSPFSPSTYLWTHTHMPSMWNTKKGIASPFGAKQIGSIALIRGKFAKEGFQSSVKAAWSQRKNLNPWSMFTGMLGKDKQYLGTQLLSRYDTMSKYKAALERRMISNVSQVVGARKSKVIGRKLTSEVMDFMATHPARTTRELIQFTGQFFNKMGYSSQTNLAAVKAIGATGKYITPSLPGRVRDIGMFRAKEVLRVGGALKWGVRAGKAASIVGMAMLAWDITQMIGRPLGAAAVNLVDQGLTKWADRFMPEMGGQLAMSYLSQGAATERQRAVQAMGRAQINGRSAFGQEASFIHQ